MAITVISPAAGIPASSSKYSRKGSVSSKGRLMRTSLIPKYAKTEKGYIGYQQIMRDELNPGEQTQLILSDLSFEVLPDRIFTKAYLEGLN